MLRQGEKEGDVEVRNGAIFYGNIESITEWWVVSVCDAQHIYHCISINVNTGYVWTGCDYLPYLDHFSGGGVLY